MNLFDLTNKTAIVTGACGLIGQKHCEALALAGANVVIADLDLTTAQAVAAGLPGAMHLPLAVDVTSARIAGRRARYILSSSLGILTCW
ncbi:MAG: SDR family NAD(P)-dependent oxidoreductase [Hymenobacter sp.]